MSESKLVILDFYANWCAPCKKLSKYLEELKDQFPNVEIKKINVDQDEELAEYHNIESLPTLVVVLKGKVVERLEGFSEEKTLSLLKKYSK